MSVVFLCRDSIPAIFIAHALSRDARLDAIVIEEGRSARRRKLRRLARATSVWRLPLTLLDILSIALYSKRISRHLRSSVLKPRGLAGYPADVPVDRFDDANDTACVGRLKELAPDVLIVLGTSILREPLLSLPRRHLLNIHSGIVPHYRNVHSNFWAWHNQDFERIGTSIIHLDAGIDTGHLALQDTIAVQPDDTLMTITHKNLELAGQLATQAVKQALDGTLPKHKQDHNSKGYYRTPGLADFLRLWRRRRDDSPISEADSPQSELGSRPCN